MELWLLVGMEQVVKKEITVTDMRNIKNIVVHCTATRRDVSKDRIAESFVKRGWKKPGYHFLIAENGCIYNLVGCEDVVNGVKGHNADSVHVAYIGGIDECGRPIDNRSQKQKDSMIVLLKRLSHIFPGSKIIGHRDLSPDSNGNGVIDPWERLKECPCFDAAEEYADL